MNTSKLQPTETTTQKASAAPTGTLAAIRAEGAKDLYSLASLLKRRGIRLLVVGGYNVSGVALEAVNVPGVRVELLTPFTADEYLAALEQIEEQTRDIPTD